MLTGFTFKDASFHHIEVGLLPELVALTEVGAEVVLVLHHVPGDAQADGGRRRRSQDTRQSVLPAGVVITRLKSFKVREYFVR